LTLKTTERHDRAPLDREDGARTGVEGQRSPTRRAVERLGMLRPLAIRDFALLWAGMTVSLFGDGIFLVAIAWQVYELSNVPTALSVVGVAWTVPMVILLVFGGVVADRFERRRVMIVSDVVRFAAIGAVGVLALAGELTLPILLGLVAVYGAGEALFAPAFGALVPDIVPGDLLVQANSIDMFVRTLASRLAGPALGGLLIAGVGTGGAFLIDAGTFAVSAACLFGLSARPVPKRDESTSAFADIRDGFRFVRSRTWLWGTLLASAVSLFAYYGPWEVLVPYIVKNTLEGDAGDLGLVFGAGGLGAVLAAVVMGSRRIPRRHMTFIYVAWAIEVGIMVIYGVATELWHAMAAAFVAGSASTAGMVVWATLMQQRVPRHLLGRVTSLDWTISIGLIPVSLAVTGPLADAIGVRATLVGAGVLAAVFTIAFLFLPGMRDAEREETVEGLA
jgi:DHA3 family tetracycline resistance protein-like MFS transporter